VTPYGNTNPAIQAVVAVVVAVAVVAVVVAELCKYCRLHKQRCSLYIPYVL